jgi:hypothetical protein
MWPRPCSVARLSFSLVTTLHTSKSVQPVPISFCILHSTQTASLKADIIMPIYTDKRGAYSNVASVLNGVGKPEQARQIQGRVRQIVIAFAVMVLPMLLLSGLLLGLIFFYRVPPNKYIHEDLGLEQDFPDAYLVHFSATMLVTVASWSSTVAPVLIGFAITLASYPAAKDLLTASNTMDTAQLPTPFQLSLIVSTLSNNSFTSLWNWSAYTFGWEGKRQGQPKALRGLTITLFMGVIFRYDFAASSLHGHS